MSIQLQVRRVALLFAIAGLIAGCASTPTNTPLTPEAFDKSLAEADAVSHAGQSDKAIGLYEQLAKNNPTREEPWSRIAQIQFTANHYGQAIVAAQEALQRDNTDRSAKSVLTVSGLRIATEALGELRDDNSLAGDARTDAQALAKSLRDTLGQDTLFPPDQEPPKAETEKRRRPVRHAVAAHAASGAVQAPAAATPAPATVQAPASPPVSAPASKPAAATRPASGSADPFSALR
jgi:tetratricopeptide (TPR) repeat protein